MAFLGLVESGATPATHRGGTNLLVLLCRRRLSSAFFRRPRLNMKPVAVCRREGYWYLFLLLILVQLVVMSDATRFAVGSDPNMDDNEFAADEFSMPEDYDDTIPGLLLHQNNALVGMLVQGYLGCCK